MGMKINYFAIPDVLAQRVVEGNLSFWDLALYALQAHYLSAREEREKNEKFPHLCFKERLEGVDYKTFYTFYKLYQYTFAGAAIPFIDGRQPYTDEEAKTLLHNYAEYSVGFLTFEDTICIYNQLINLSFKDFIKIKFKEGDSRNREIIEFLDSDFYLRRDGIEYLSYIEDNYYYEFVGFIDKLAKTANKQKLGLFISIN